MREKGYGRGQHGLGRGIYGNFGQTNYGAAKAGLVGFTNVLAQEGAKFNIKSNVIAPVAKTRMTEDLLGPLGDALEPEKVTPVVVYLASEECEVNGEIYSVAGGQVSRFFIGRTPGYFNADLTVEDVRDNLGQIRAEEGYTVPHGISEELGLLLEVQEQRPGGGLPGHRSPPSTEPWTRGSCAGTRSGPARSAPALGEVIPEITARRRSTPDEVNARSGCRDQPAAGSGRNWDQAAAGRAARSPSTRRRRLRHERPDREKSSSAGRRRRW
jgi:hypothetical protein